MKRLRLSQFRKFGPFLVLWYSLQLVSFADGTDELFPSIQVDGPDLITGTLYAMGSHQQKILYHFKRTATRSGSSVKILRQYIAPDGTVAASESVLYQSNRLVSCRLREFQADLSGYIEVQPNHDQPGQDKLLISFGNGPVPTKSDTQPLKPDTLIDDTIYPFMLLHWDDMMRGGSAKFHFISIEWRRTFNFRIFKSGETLVNGRICEQIEMQPSGVLLSKLVEPLYFSIEKAPPHRILAYAGRTTPRVRNGDSWKYLDAETVFDPFETASRK